MGTLVLTYVQKHKHKWSHYLPIVGEFSFWPLDDIFASTNNGSIENMTIETSNFLMEGKFISIFQVDGAQISTPPNKSTNNNIPTFQHVSLLEGSNLARK